MAKEKSTETLRLPTLRVKQGKSRVLYSFAVDGKLLHNFVTISRIARDESEEIEGVSATRGSLAHL